MAEKTNIEWAVGDHVKHRGHLSEIVTLRNPTTLRSITFYENGIGITSGGICMMGGDHLAELEPVTDEVDLLLIKGFAALQAVEEARAIIAKGEEDAKVYNAAVRAIFEARKAARGG